MKRYLIAIAFSAAASAAHAQVQVKEPWVRATVPSRPPPAPS